MARTFKHTPKWTVVPVGQPSSIRPVRVVPDNVGAVDVRKTGDFDKGKASGARGKK